MHLRSRSLRLALRIGRVLMAALLVFGAASMSSATLTSTRTTPAEREEDLHLPELASVEISAKLARVRAAGDAVAAASTSAASFLALSTPRTPPLPSPPALSRYSARRQI